MLRILRDKEAVACEQSRFKRLFHAVGKRNEDSETIMTHETLTIRALKTSQGDGADVYSFFAPGRDIVRIADISRLERDEDEDLRGFQRKDIKNHIKNIVAVPQSRERTFSERDHFGIHTRNSVQTIARAEPEESH